MRVVLCVALLSLVGLVGCTSEGDDPGGDGSDAAVADSGTTPEPNDGGGNPADGGGERDAGTDAGADAGGGGPDDSGTIDEDAEVPIDSGVDAGGCPSSMPADCAGTCGGTAEEDCAGTCNGAAEEDCAGTCNGTAEEDCAGTCNGTAVADCAGTCNGTAVADCAGTCNGTAVVDCAGTCNGALVVDCAGTCNGALTEDCAGACGGSAVEDCAGTCNGTATEDCAGTCNGTAVADCAGTCNGTAVQDCLGVCNGAAVCAAPTPGSLVVSEVMFNPNALDDTLAEWFEVHNTTATALHLQGCTVQDNAGPLVPIDTALAVAPGGYATFARTAGPGFTPSFVYGNALQLSNSSDRIVITCNGTEIERFEYNSALYGPVPGTSLSVTPTALNAAQNELALNWCNGMVSFNGDLGTPGTTNSSCVPVVPGAGDVVISEFMPNPGVLLDSAGEWFELYNASPDPLDLGGCELKDDDIDSTLVSMTLVLLPGELATFAVSASPGFTPTFVYPLADMALANSADELEVVCGGTSIDRIAYDASWGIASGISVSLDPGALDAASNDGTANWCAGAGSYNGDLGTPGTENASCSL